MTSRSSRAASSRSPALPAASSSLPTTRCPAEPRLPGAHNRENAAAATAAARAAGISDEAIADGARELRGRATSARARPGGRRRPLVNDSKATNPEAAERALARLSAGAPRDPRRQPQGNAVRRARCGAPAERGVACAYLIGESADEIAEALAGEGVRFRHSVDLEQAVADAYADAESGRGRPPLARLRELRPVPRLRGARRERFRAARGGAVRRPARGGSRVPPARPRHARRSSLSASSWSTARAPHARALAADDPAYYLKRQALYAAARHRRARRSLPHGLPPPPLRSSRRSCSRASRSSSPCSSSGRR